MSIWLKWKGIVETLEQNLCIPKIVTKTPLHDSNWENWMSTPFLQLKWRCINWTNILDEEYVVDILDTFMVTIIIFMKYLSNMLFSSQFYYFSSMVQSHQSPLWHLLDDAKSENRIPQTWRFLKDHCIHEGKWKWSHNIDELAPNIVPTFILR